MAYNSAMFEMFITVFYKLGVRKPFKGSQDLPCNTTNVCRDKLQASLREVKIIGKEYLAAP